MDDADKKREIRRRYYARRKANGGPLKGERQSAELVSALETARSRLDKPQAIRYLRDIDKVREDQSVIDNGIRIARGGDFEPSMAAIVGDNADGD